MALYGIGLLTTNTTTANAAMDVANPTGVRARIRKWAITLTAATASAFALNRTTALGTRTAPVALLAGDNADPALTGITLVDSAVAHSVQPTFSANDICLTHLPATIGAGRVWTFEDDLVAAVSLSIALANRGTTGAVRSEVVVDV